MVNISKALDATPFHCHHKECQNWLYYTINSYNTHCILKRLSSKLQNIRTDSSLNIRHTPCLDHSIRPSIFQHRWGPWPNTGALHMLCGLPRQPHQGYWMGWKGSNVALYAPFLCRSTPVRKPCWLCNRLPTSLYAMLFTSLYTMHKGILTRYSGTME